MAGTFVGFPEVSPAAWRLTVFSGTTNPSVRISQCFVKEVRARYLFRSLPLGAKQTHIPQISDGDLVNAITNRVSSYVKKTSGAGHIYVETAGGNWSLW